MVSKEELVRFLKEEKDEYNKTTREEKLRRKYGQYLSLEVKDVTEDKAEIELRGEGKALAASLMIKDWVKSEFDVDVEMIINTDTSFRPDKYTVIP